MILYDDIVLRRPEKSYLQEFIHMCCQKEDYKKYISELAGRYEKYLVICKGEKAIGIFLPNINDNTGVRTAEPVFYMHHKKSPDTLKAIQKIFCFLIEIEKVEKIDTRVYSHNKEMLSILGNLKMNYEGYMPYAEIIDGEYKDVYYYSFTTENM